jgi:hypothetical protein
MYKLEPRYIIRERMIRITNTEKWHKSVRTVKFYKCYNLMCCICHSSIHGATTETNVKRTGPVLLYFVISLKG